MLAIGFATAANAQTDTRFDGIFEPCRSTAKMFAGDVESKRRKGRNWDLVKITLQDVHRDCKDTAKIVFDILAITNLERFELGIPTNK